MRVMSQPSDNCARAGARKARCAASTPSTAAEVVAIADEAAATAAMQAMSASDFDVCSQWNTLHGLVGFGDELEFVSVCATPVLCTSSSAAKTFDALEETLWCHERYDTIDAAVMMPPPPPYWPPWRCASLARHRSAV